MAGVMSRNDLNPTCGGQTTRLGQSGERQNIGEMLRLTLEMTSAVSRKSVHLGMDVRAKKSSINRVPML